MIAKSIGLCFDNLQTQQTVVAFLRHGRVQKWRIYYI